MSTNKLLSASWWSDALERAVSSGANSAVTILTMGGVSLLTDVPWYSVLSAAGIAALLDLLRSLAAAPRGNTGTAGFTPAIEASTQPTTITRFTAAVKAKQKQAKDRAS